MCCVVNDNNINNDNSLVGDLRDDYTMCPAPLAICAQQDIFGPNIHALQINKQNTDINPTPITDTNPMSITSSNPTLEETMREKVPDEDDDLPEGSEM
ncbi:hypothetical protein L484_006560 [Morus notabilis]|uniref:Uncharacterized protein n=1 Tax=Morus notabilis TaxID=981085 RepID=W9RXE7_9ROSA|nr:hypothetical protein L484_006560 [Morus notabilis]